MTEVWQEYACTECTFRMLLPPDDAGLPPKCPECGCHRSLWFVRSRKVGSVVRRRHRTSESGM
jgi:hypothetical protein